MKYIQKGCGVVLTEYDSFDIEEILECGQCFRFTKLGEKAYQIIALNKVLTVSHVEEGVLFSPCTCQEFESIWMDFFDLKRDYAAIKKELSEKDPVLREATQFAGGIRILNQDIWECLISFIISQNSRIPMIRQVIRNISEVYGERLEEGAYAFPTPDVLQKVSVEAIMNCKTGFRGKYIIDAARKVASGDVAIENFGELTTDEIRQSLMTIYGVGHKVADCVILFSCRRPEVFPTDVWVKRVMQYYYFENREVPIRDIHKLAGDNWGALAGYAQQYLFHYARQQRIGVKQ